MALALVAARKLAPTELAREGLLPSVRADVSGEVVAAAEAPHADPTLEGLVARVDAQVPGQLVRAAEAAVTALCGARVGPLVERGLARPIGVLAGSDGLESEWRLGQAAEARVDLLVFEGLDGLQRGNRGWVDPDGVHALEGLVFRNGAHVVGVVVQVVVRNHGEKIAVQGRRLGRLVILGRIGEPRVTLGVVERHGLRIEITAVGIGG